MLPNLTKENFFNALEEKYPEAVKKFKSWIDAYKVQVNWDSFFKCNEGTGETVKFHELPIEIQAGILGRFLVEQFNPEHPGAYQNAAGQQYRSYLEDCFRGFEDDIKRRQFSPN